MIGFQPRRPQGSTDEARFMQWVWDMLTGPLRPMSATGEKTDVTTRGTHRVKIATNTRRQTQLSVQKVTYVSQTADYLVCTDANSATVNVAKPKKLRGGTSATIRGVAVTYGTFDWDAQTRVASCTLGTETQVIVPLYIAGDPIEAISLDETTTGVTGVTLMDLNEDARAWARKSTQP